MSNIKNLLRTLKVLNGSFSDFHTDNVPETPHELFIKWLHTAIREDVLEPHAMTISTVDHDGYPDARVLILKNIDDNGWYFATSSESRKGKQLAEQSKVAYLLLARTWKASKDTRDCRRNRKRKERSRFFRKKRHGSCSCHDWQAKQSPLEQRRIKQSSRSKNR